MENKYRDPEQELNRCKKAIDSTEAALDEAEQALWEELEKRGEFPVEKETAPEDGADWLIIF